MSEKLLIIDNNVIQNLYAAGGEQAWSQLLKTGSRVVVPSDILEELEPSGLRPLFEMWISSNGSDKVFVPDYFFEPPDTATYTGDRGDDAIRALTRQELPEARNALAAYDVVDADFRILTDDGRFFRQMKSQDGFDKASLAARGQYEMPYHGSFEFLAERLANGDISKSEYNVLRENFENSPRYTSLDTKAGSNFRGQIMNEREVANFDQTLLQKLINDSSGSANTKFALSAGILAGAIEVARQAGIIGDVLSFGITAAHASDLLNDPDLSPEEAQKAANKIWVAYIFETAGGIGGGVLGMLGAAYALKGAGGLWGPILGAVAGSVAGSLAGADLGEYLYDTFPEVFDPLFDSIYERQAELEATEIPSGEALALAVIASLGFDFTTEEGSDQEDWLVGTKWQERSGGAGDDVLLGWKPDYVPAGSKVDPDNPNSGTAPSELRMTLNGGEGDDWLIALGGTGTILVGGEGRDFLFNTSFKGQLYGDTVDAVGQSTSGEDDSDVFWHWPSTFIIDAQPNDILQLFGLPLLGGTNMVGGVAPVGNGALAMDWFNPFVFYGATDSGQLLVINALAASLGIGAGEGDDFPAGTMVVENYDFGGWQSEAWGRPAPGDLGMTFRIGGVRDNSVEISLWNSVWGHLFTYLDAMSSLAKTIRWQPVDDPLVLDLDGDGIETIAQSQSRVHFDLDGDYFAEQTGWLSADDGFLVMDRNGNGRIDDITEMFGAPDVSGYQELAALDEAVYGGNGDGLITIDDAQFAELAVWRDLDRDGVTDTGELFSLTDLDITGFALDATPLDSVTPQGTRLRETATFTRGDGTTGNTFEAVFETNPTDTVYRGDNGIAAWVKNTPTAKGFGAMSELAVAASNDFELTATVHEAATAMTLPDLTDLRAKATPVFGAWAEALELTRELTPVLLAQNQNDATTLIDRGVYVEDESGGYWILASGAPIVDASGNTIDRATLENVLAMAAADGQAWQLEQVFSPASRSEALQHRTNAPYLVEMVDGRAVVQDYGIENADGSWRLASGTEITDASGNVIAAPALEDVLAAPHAADTEWRTEAIGFNPYANLPVDQIGVQLIDGTVVDYSVQIADADGTFHVWARNLDRALELQHSLGRPDEFNLRNYALDFETLDEVGSTDDSAYRVELMTAGQLHFAASIYGIDFQPEIMAAAKDPDTGLLTYSVGSFDGTAAPSQTEDGAYVSTIEPAIQLFDVMMQNYIAVSRGVAVRLALQGGLADFARELDYDPGTDQFRATGDRELAPMFEAIFEGAPAGAEAAYDYLVAWNEILEVIYPDYHLDETTNLLTGTLKLDQKFVFQMLLAAFENVTIDAELDAVMNALGVDETLLIDGRTGAAELNGTSGDDFIYVTGSGTQTYRGGYGQDTYFIGQSFGSDTIDEREEPLRPKAADEVRFVHARSTDVRATMDGLNLVLKVNGTDDTLTIKDQFLGDLVDPLFGFNFAPDTGVSSIVFADGVIWNKLEITQAVSHPLASDDLVLGGEEKDWIEASRGNDVLRGGRDGDIYIFRAGDGDDRVDDANDRPTDDPVAKADILQFVGTGITPDTISYRRAGESDDLEMVIFDENGIETGDRVTIEGQFDWINVPILGLMHPDRIERIAFEDGSFLTEADAMARRRIAYGLDKF